MIWFWVVLLFAAGVALILAEFIVPGAVCGILGGILVVASTVIGCAYAGDAALWVILGEAVGVVASIILGFTLLTRTRAGKFIILSSTQDPAAGWVAWETDENLVGREGEVLARLRPAGAIQIDGKRIDVVSTGEYIEAGQRVRILEVHGSRVVVEKVNPEQT